jgi:hypothetical protein
LNGRKVPEVCDGRVLEEILVDSDRPVLDRGWRRFLTERRSVAYGREQIDEITERLQDLGYLSDD